MKTDNPKTPKYSRRAKCLFWLGGAVAAYTIVGFLAAPAIVKSQMLKRLPAMLKRPVAVEQVRMNPYALSVTIRGLAVKETNGAPFAGFDEFYASLKLSSFFRRGWAVREVSLAHPYAQIVRGKDGRLNFADIVAAAGGSASPAPAPGPKAALPLVMVDTLHIDNADVTLDDFVPPKPVHTRLLPIRFKLDGLSTAGGARNPFVFSATSDSHEVSECTGAFTLDPIQVTGHLGIKGLDLKKYSPYLANFVSAEVADGRLDVTADYTAGLGTNGVELSMEKGLALLKSLSVKSTATGETVVTVPSLSVSWAEASLGKKLIHITSLGTMDGTLLVRREQDGKINLLSLLNPPANSPAPAVAPASSQIPWTAVVDEIAVDRYAVALEDKKPAKPARFTVDEITFKAKGFSTAGNDPMATDVSARLNEAGRFTARGSVRLRPPSADLTMELVGLDLRPFQPYVEEQVKLAVTHGLLSLQGKASYNSGKGFPLAAFAGDLGLTNFATTDLIHFKDFVKLDALSVRGIKFAFQPNQVEVGEIKLSGLNTSVIVDRDKQINLLAVLPKSQAAPSNAPAAAALDFPAALGSLVIENASFHFSDQSIEPNCLFDVQQLEGTVTGLSSQPGSRAAVDLRGKVDEVSTFSVSGSANPLGKELSADVTIDCKNINLAPFTPYMEKFGGYQLERGKLVLDLHHNITGRRLNASNHVVISQLTLGPKNNSPDATHLPVKLGIALLKDRAGNVTLDVPLKGTLGSPEFKLGPIVMQIIGNILAKAATSPFTLLGALFGGGGEELSFIDFSPGLADIPAPEQGKIDKLAKALYERPALQLEISATADPAADSPVLARLKLGDQIRSLRVKELIAAGTPAETAQSVKVEPADYARLLKSLYLQTIGTNTLAPLQTNAPAIALETTPSSPPSATSATSTPSTTLTNVTVLPRMEVSAKSRVPLARLRIFMKGGELMMRRTFAGAAMYITAAPPRSPARPLSSSPAARAKAAPTTNAAAAPVGAPAQEQMEAALIAGIQITSDDLLALMQARERSVQAALVASGKVEGERLFILAPKPISLSAQGQTRANLSLE